MLVLRHNVVITGPPINRWDFELQILLNGTTEPEQRTDLGGTELITLLAEYILVVFRTFFRISVISRNLFETISHIE